MKSIAILCNYRLEPNRVGGMDYFFWEFDTACKEAGHQITWFFPNAANHGKYPGMDIIAAGNNSIVECFLKTISATSKNYDTIVTHFLELCTPFYKTVKQKTGARIIAVDHNPRPSVGYSLKKRLKKQIYSCLYSHFTDLFIAVSEQTLSDLLNDFRCIKRTQTKVIFNGLPVNKIKTRIRNNTSTIKFMVSSHLRPDKGLKDLITAYNNLTTEAKNKATIDIYGDGPEREELMQLIYDYKIEPYISLKGSTKDIHEKYAEYDFLIHPSHAETFCYAVVEALLANLPVITTHYAGNILNLVESNRNGFLYPIGDIHRLTSIIQKVIEEQIKLSIDSRASYAKLFSTERMVAEYISTL
jgi:glycosyltransferase involved in cell wall biosynthesis